MKVDARDRLASSHATWESWAFDVLRPAATRCFVYRGSWLLHVAVESVPVAKVIWHRSPVAVICSSAGEARGEIRGCSRGRAIESEIYWRSRESAVSSRNSRMLGG